MDEKKSCVSCSYLEMTRGQWYDCSLHKEHIEDDSQAETCPDFWKIFTPTRVLKEDEALCDECDGTGFVAKTYYKSVHGIGEDGMPGTVLEEDYTDYDSPCRACRGKGIVKVRKA